MYSRVYTGNACLGTDLGGRAIGVKASGGAAGVDSSCAKRLRLPGPRDSLPAGGVDSPENCNPAGCADPGRCLFRKGDELIGVFTIRDAL